MKSHAAAIAILQPRAKRKGKRKRAGGSVRAATAFLEPRSYLGKHGLAAVRIPLQVVSEANHHEHWRVRRDRRRAQQMAVERALTGWKVPPCNCVAFIRIAPRKLDSDNNVGAFKHCRDAVATWLGIDDGDERVRWCYAQEKPGKPGAYAIIIEFIVE